MTEYALVSPDGELLATRDYDDGVSDASARSTHPNKPYLLPVDVDDPDFDPASEVKEGPVWVLEKDRAIRRFTVRNKTADEIAAMRAEIIAAIKDEAGRRILAIMPDYKQRNALALGVEMVTTYGPDPANWPSGMKETYGTIMKVWVVIKAIRARSDVLELAVPPDAAGIAAFDPLKGWD